MKQEPLEAKWTKLEIGKLNRITAQTQISVEAASRLKNCARSNSAAPTDDATDRHSQVFTWRAQKHNWASRLRSLSHPYWSLNSPRTSTHILCIFTTSNPLLLLLKFLWTKGVQSSVRTLTDQKSPKFL